MGGRCSPLPWAAPLLMATQAVAATVWSARGGARCGPNRRREGRLQPVRRQGSTAWEIGRFRPRLVVRQPLTGFADDVRFMCPRKGPVLRLASAGPFFVSQGRRPIPAASGVRSRLISVFRAGAVAAVDAGGRAEGCSRPGGTIRLRRSSSGLLHQTAGAR